MTIFSSGKTDTRGELLDGAGAILASDSGSGAGGNNFRMTETLAPGAYYIAVSGESGSYSLSAELAAITDHGDTAANSTLLPLHGAAKVQRTDPSALLSTIGRIDEAAADLDFFRIDVPRNGVDVVVRSAGDTDTRGRLLDSSLNEVMADEGGDGNFHIATKLDAGTYYVEVMGHEAGRYRVIASGSDAECACLEELQAKLDHGDTAEASTLMSIGPPLTGGISGSSDTDVFRIDVVGSATVVFATFGPTDTRGLLRDGTGAMLASDDSGGTQGHNFSIQADLDPGVYYLEVSGEVGDYAVAAQLGGERDHGDTAAQSTLLTLYSESDTMRTQQSLLTTVGRIDVAQSDIDVFRLDIPRDKTDLTVRSAGDTDTFARLRDSSLTELSMNEGGNGNFRITAQVDAGIYYLEVGGHEAGRYRVLAWGDSKRDCPCADRSRTIGGPARDGSSSTFPATAWPARAGRIGHTELFSCKTPLPIKEHP